MKKKLLSVLLAVLLVMSLFAGCAAKTADRDTMVSAPMAYDKAENYVMTGTTADGYYYTTDGDDFVEYEVQVEESLSDVIASASKTYNLDTEKIIYTAYADIETLEFDDTVQAVYEMMERFGAYIESSSVSGSDYASKYYGGRTHRNASFSIRVPVKHYSEMSSSLTEIGNVTRYSSESQNITPQFTDTESRLKAYRTEYDRLLEMMENAKTVDEMIQVEARLSEVEYNIESLTGTLRVWQDKVDYSTIHLSIREVYEYTEPVIEPQSFWERVAEAFGDSIEWLGEAGKDIVVFIVSAVPILIFPVVIIVIIVVAIRAKRKKKKALRAAEEEQAALRRAEWDAKNKRDGE